MIKYGLALIATASISLTALAEPYSPAVRDTFPDNVYWGDTHVHTFFSGDAYSMGNSVTPDEAYRFARARRFARQVARTSDYSDPSIFSWWQTTLRTSAYYRDWSRGMPG